MGTSYQVRIEKETLKKINKQKQDVRHLIYNSGRKIELMGNLAGKLISIKHALYEIKLKHPPLRIYFHLDDEKKIAWILEIEMKTSKKKQRQTISRLKRDLEK